MGQLAVDRDNLFGRHLVRALCVDSRHPTDVVRNRPVTFTGNRPVFTGGSWLWDGASHFNEGHAGDFDVPQFTVAVRCRLDGALDDYYIPISVGDAANNNGFRLQRSDFFTGWEYRIAWGGSQNTITGADATGSFQTLTGTFDGSTMRLYVDGAEQSNGAATRPVYSGGGVNLRVAAWITGGSLFDGAIDYIYYLDTCLSPGQVNVFMRDPFQCFMPA